MIDGSNLLAQLDACGLSYPALSPLVQQLVGADDLVFARFYSAPQIAEPYRSRWQAFQSANRHVQGLQWFQGYRNQDNAEKTIDVALAVDLVYGCSHNHFDRVAVIGGDSDHYYAIKVAHASGREIRVFLMPNQPSTELKGANIRFSYLEVRNLLAWGVCDRGAQQGVPVAHRAPSGSPDLTVRFKGPMAQQITP